MSEYIEFVVRVPKDEADFFIARFGRNNVKILGYSLGEEIVRCCDCVYRYGCLHLLDNGDDDMRRCNATPEGYCGWGRKVTWV